MATIKVTPEIDSKKLKEAADEIANFIIDGLTGKIKELNSGFVNTSGGGPFGGVNPIKESVISSGGGGKPKSGLEGNVAGIAVEAATDIAKGSFEGLIQLGMKASGLIAASTLAIEAYEQILQTQKFAALSGQTMGEAAKYTEYGFLYGTLNPLVGGEQGKRLITSLLSNGFRDEALTQGLKFGSDLIGEYGMSVEEASTFISKGRNLEGKSIAELAKEMRQFEFIAKDTTLTTKDFAKEVEKISENLRNAGVPVKGAEEASNIFAAAINRKSKDGKFVLNSAEREIAVGVVSMPSSDIDFMGKLGAVGLSTSQESVNYYRKHADVFGKDYSKALYRKITAEKAKGKEGHPFEIAKVLGGAPELANAQLMDTLREIGFGVTEKTVNRDKAISELRDRFRQKDKSFREGSLDQFGSGMYTGGMSTMYVGELLNYLGYPTALEKSRKLQKKAEKMISQGKEGSIAAQIGNYTFIIELSKDLRNDKYNIRVKEKRTGRPGK